MSKPPGSPNNSKVDKIGTPCPPQPCSTLDPFFGFCDVLGKLMQSPTPQKGALIIRWATKSGFAGLTGLRGALGFRV